MQTVKRGEYCLDQLYISQLDRWWNNPPQVCRSFPTHEQQCCGLSQPQTTCCCYTLYSSYSDLSLLIFQSFSQSINGMVSGVMSCQAETDRGGGWRDGSVNVLSVKRGPCELIPTQMMSQPPIYLTCSRF